MTEFQEVDARLGGMHGYEPVATTQDVTKLGEHMQYRLGRLEAKVDALMKALQAGAIGKWTP